MRYWGFWVVEIDQYSPENSRVIAAGVPNAELVIVEGANHSVHIEKPDLVFAKIRSHLDS